MNKFISSIQLACLLFGVANAELIRSNTQEVVYDTKTKLLWQDNSEVKNLKDNWDNSTTYCTNLNHAGLIDWRLPNNKELMGIVDSSYEPTINQEFKNCNKYDYWSSTENVNSTDKVWTTYFFSGSSNNSSDKKSMNYVRCVREGQLSKALMIEFNNAFERIAITERKQKDREYYNTASSQNTISAYKSYLKEFPNGEYTSSARSNIQYLEEENRFRALLQSKSPQTMYLEAGKQERNGNTSKATKLYEVIIDRFPNSDFAVKASDKLTGASRAENEASNRRSQSRQECENNKNACLAGCGGYISGADSHNSNMWQCKNKCEQISCY